MTGRTSSMRRSASSSSSSRPIRSGQRTAAWAHHGSKCRARPSTVIGHSTDDGSVGRDRGCDARNGRTRPLTTRGGSTWRSSWMSTRDSSESPGASSRGARPRPRDRARRGRPLRDGLDGPGCGQGLLPRRQARPVRRSCASTSGPVTRRPRSIRSRWRSDMQRRRIAILLTTVAALTVMALGGAIGAQAKQDTLGTVHSVTARFNSIQQATRPATFPSTSAPSSRASGRWASTTSTSTWSATRAPIRPSPRRSSTSRRRTAASSSSPSNGCGRRAARDDGADGPRPDMLLRRTPHRTDTGSSRGFYERHYWLYKTNPLGARSRTGTRTCRATAPATTAADRRPSRSQATGGDDSLRSPRLAAVRPGTIGR